MYFYSIILPHTQVLLKHNAGYTGPSVVLNDAVTHWLYQNAQYSWSYRFLEHLDLFLDPKNTARIGFESQEDYLIFCLYWVGIAQHPNDFLFD